jgi:uncharacterized protein with von Willebrand factor type A (vWA) domain
MTLVDRHIEFVAALRRGGLPVSVAETLDAATAMGAVDLLQRAELRAALAATLVKRSTHRPVFDLIFDLFYPPVIEPAASALPDEEAARSPAGRGGAGDDAERDRIRAELARYLREGGEDLVEAVAREAVDVFGATGGRGRPAWSRLATLEEVSARTLVAGVLDAVLAGAERGGLAERRARALIEQRIERFEQQVETEIRRRLAEINGAAAIAGTFAAPPIERVNFLNATRAELTVLRREVQPLARRLAARLAIDQRRGQRGALDFRRTIRASLSSGGVPLQTEHRPKRPLKSDLVILCDMSESVSSFAHFTLLLVYALREVFIKVRAFGFVDELDEVTRFFAPAGDAVAAISRLSREADVTGLIGRTDYGHAFELFAERFPSAVGPRTSLLILGDARSNYGDIAAPTLARLAARAKHAYWLNPEREGLWDTGDSRAGDLGAVVPMVECRNLVQLEEFVRALTHHG